MKDILRVADVAAECDVNAVSVQRWLTAGIRGIRLRGTMMGGTWRIERADMETFLAELTRKALGEVDSPVPHVDRNSTPAALRRRDKAARERLRSKGMHC
jgi:hypothetical protein